MSVSTGEKIETLNVCFGTYPHTKALKEGKIKSDRVALQFTEINPVNRAFMPMAREQKFDISEMAIVTYLQAKAYDKPLVLNAVLTISDRCSDGSQIDTAGPAVVALLRREWPDVEIATAPHVHVRDP